MISLPVIGPGSRKAKRQGLRWLRWLLLGLLLLVTTTAGTVALVLLNLDSPFVRRRVQALVARRAGLDVDYGQVEVHLLSGVRISDLVVRSPAPFRQAAPELAHLGALEVAWSPAGLLGVGPLLERMALRDLALF